MDLEKSPPQKEVTVLSSALRSATTNSDELENDGYRGVRLIVDISAEDGAVTLTPKIQAIDHLSGNAVDLPGAAFTGLTATGTYMLTVYPGIAETANETVDDILPKRWRVAATMSGSTSMTYSISATLLK